LASGALVASVCSSASSIFSEGGEHVVGNALVVAAFAHHAVIRGVASAVVASAGKGENLGDCKSKDNGEDNSLHG